MENRSHRVFSFHATPVSAQDAQICRDNVGLYAKYRRRLAELENYRRERISWLDRTSPLIVSLQADIRDRLDVINAECDAEGVSKDARKRRRNNDKALIEMRKSVNAERRRCREDEPHWKIAMAEADEICREQQTLARGYSGLASTDAKTCGCWAVYLVAEDAFKDSRKTTKPWARLDMEVPDDEGPGAAVRLTNPERPFRTESLFDQDGLWVRVGTERYGLGARQPDGYRRRAIDDHDVGRSGQIGAKRLTHVAMRVGKKNGEPVWVNFHVLMHREIPAGTVLWAKVFQSRHRRGTYQYEMQFTVICDEREAAPAPTAEGVGVDLGWSLGYEIDQAPYWVRDTGGNSIRLAVAKGTDGEVSQLIIPAMEVIEKVSPNGRVRTVKRGIWERQPKRDDLEGIRKKNLNEFVDALTAYVRSIPVNWLFSATTRAHQWESIDRVNRLFARWQNERFDGDADMFECTRAFLKQDRHLDDWHWGQGRRVRNQIDGVCDAWFAKLTNKYGTIAVEDLDIKKMREEDTAAGEITAKRGQILALGRQLLALKNAGLKRGRSVYMVPPEYTSQDCAECGCRRKLADKKAPILTCDKCGHTEDRDITGARNILTRGLEMRASGAPAYTGVKEKKPEDEATVARKAAAKATRPKRERMSRAKLLKKRTVPA